MNEQSPVLSAERKQKILDRLRASGRVLASDLTATLGVSDDTVRRDLRDLAAAGLLQRVHGGALLPTPAHATFAERRERHVAEKARLAESAVHLFRDGLTVIVDGGTTNAEIARRIPRELRLTVVTNSPPVALALAEHPGVETIVVGGRLDRETLSAVGTTAARAIAAVNADLLILGVCSVHPESGLSVASHEEAELKRLMIERAAEVVAVVTAEKLDTVAPFVVGPVGALAEMIVEREVAEEVLASYRALGVVVTRG